MTTAAAPPEPTAEPPPLVFQWERRRRAHWRLAGVLGLSLLVHAVAFYVFQVTYTPTGSQAAPSVRVTMLPADRPDASPEARALARWLALADPALTTESASPETGREAGGLAEYVPSYKAGAPPFKPLDPPVTESAAPPRPRPPGPVPVAVPAAAAPARPAAIDAPTRVTLSSGIAARAPSTMPPVGFVLPSGAKMLSPAVFLVGVREGGGEPYLFREAGSGDVAADDFARDYLARLGFQPLPTAAGGEVDWGWAEFHWGRDVYRQPLPP